MTRLDKQWIIRSLWTIFLLATLAILVLSLPGYITSKAIFATPYSLPESLKLLGTIIWWLRNILSLFGSILSIVLAILIYKRKPTDVMAVFLSFYLLFYSVIMAGPLEIFFQFWLPDSPDLGTRIQSLVLSLPGMTLMLIFPNGKFQPRWTRYLVWLGIILTISASFLAGDQMLLPTTQPAQIIIGLLYILFLISLFVQIYRYFAVYTYQERQQAKWVFFGILAWIVTMGISSVPYYYLQFSSPGQVPVWSNLLSPFWFLSLSIIPVSISIAILHSRLWEIDVIIRKTLVYSLLTGMLGLFYFGGVALFQSILTNSGSQPSPIVIVGTTLAIAALFNPLRKRLQDFIDRRFYRQKYNAEKALADFAAAARNETDLDLLSRRLNTTIDETLQPEQVSLWLSSQART
jgi:hypothetical protein